MNTAIVVISLITLIFVGASLIVAIRHGTKPRILAYFPDGSTQARYTHGEELSVSFHIKNVGTKFLMPNIATTDTSLFVYTPLKFVLKKITLGPFTNSKVFNTPADGIFKEMQYLVIGGFSLYYGEVESFTVDMIMPTETGQYTICIAMMSKEGDLGIKNLEICIL